MKWRPASAVFLGGTKEGLALKGRTVKNRVFLLSSPLYDPINHKNEKRDVHANSVGLIANAVGDELLVAYPKTPGAVPTTLDTMPRSNAIFVIKINWPKFRMQFDIEG